MNTPPTATAATADRQQALVLVSHGATARVRLAAGTEVLARAAGRDLQFVCGDEVMCATGSPQTQWQLQQVLPRRSALYRTNIRGRAELVAANLTLLVVVIAPLPEPDLFLADRYLAAASCAGIGSLLLVNKAEAALPASLSAEIAGFEAAGTLSLICSAHSGLGLEALRTRVRDETVMLVGQSGVGKSSLLRELIPGSDPAVGALLKTDQGRHTTSAAHLHSLPGGGALIDSPGVRDFAPAVDALAGTTLGFNEVAQHAPHCRFADCRHLKEPQCAVLAAVASGAISARRYESFRRLRRLRDQLLERVPYPRR